MIPGCVKLLFVYFFPAALHITAKRPALRVAEHCGEPGISRTPPAPPAPPLTSWMADSNLPPPAPPMTTWMAVNHTSPPALSPPLLPILPHIFLHPPHTHHHSLPLPPHTIMPPHHCPLLLPPHTLTPQIHFCILRVGVAENGVLRVFKVYWGPQLILKISLLFII